MKKYRRILWLILLSVVVIYGVAQVGGVELSQATLAEVNWGWFVVMLACFYVSILARGWRWQRILRAMGWQVNRRYITTLLTAGMFGSMVLPARLGDLGRIALLRRDHEIPISKGLASVASERALDLFAILSLAGIGALIALQSRVPSDVLWLMGITGVLIAVGVMGLVGMPSLEPFLRDLTFLRRRLPQPTLLWTGYDKAVDFGFSLIHGVRAVASKPLLLMLVIIDSFHIWLYDALIVHTGLLSAGVSPAFSVSLFASMISDLTIAIPITPGGIGQFELALVGLLSLFDLPTSETSLGAILMRGGVTWSFLIVGGLVTYTFGFAQIFNQKAEETD